MKDKYKIKDRLLEEFAKLRYRTNESEKLGTKRKETEEKLLESEERFKQFFDNNPEYCYIISPEGLILDVNNVALEVLGYKKEELVGKPLKTIYAPESLPKMKEIFAKWKKAGELKNVEMVIITKYGKRRTVLLSANAMRDKDGKIWNSVSMHKDITQLKHAEEALRESEECFRIALKNSPITVFRQDSDLRFTWAYNPGLDFKVEEILGKTDEDFIPSEEAAKVIAIKRKVLETGRPTREELSFSVGGQTSYHDLTVEPMHDRAGQIIGITCAVIDITKHKLAEEELREKEEFNFALFQHNPIQIIVVDREGRVIKINMAKRKSGDRVPNIGDVMYKDYAGGHEIDMYSELMECIRSGKTKTFPELKYEDKFLNVSISSFPKGAIITSQDITEQKQAEKEQERLQAQLIHSEKMAGIGTLASGIAHEFNNLLHIMRGHAEFAQRTKKAEDMEEALDVVLKTSDEVTKIIGDLLTFSREEASEKEKVLCDITEPIELVLSLMEEHLKKQNIEVVRKYGRTPQIEVNNGEMQQVFLNIVTNARDAMLPKGGKLEIETKRVKENIEVSISDTGKGIEKEDLGKLFEPFYTTKRTIGEDSEFQGTGLGLSVSYGIVKRHGGTIKVKSELNKGSTFTVKLPLKRKGRTKIRKR